MSDALGEATELLHRLTAEHEPTDNMDDCLYCGKSGCYSLSDQWAIVHAADCPYLMARQFVARHHVNEKAARLEAGAYI